MLFILGSILFSALLVILFKVFEPFKVDTFQVIVFNYITATLLSFVFHPSFDPLALSAPLWLCGSIIGILFISIFYLIGFSVKRVGIAPVSVAQKMSLVIPTLFGIFWLNDATGALKWIGLVLAVLAIYLSVHKGKEEEKAIGVGAWLCPLLIFAGSGCVDSLIKYTQLNYVNAAQEKDFVLITYLVCAIAGVVVLPFQLWKMKKRIEWKNVVAGIALGTPNYCSMVFFVKSLALPGLATSVFFPINNLGIILFSTATGYFLFKEKISKTQLLGIGLAIVAIVMISYAL